jgi:hypothetical protein
MVMILNAASLAALICGAPLQQPVEAAAWFHSPSEARSAASIGL